MLDVGTRCIIGHFVVGSVCIMESSQSVYSRYMSAGEVLKERESVRVMILRIQCDSQSVQVYIAHKKQTRDQDRVNNQGSIGLTGDVSAHSQGQTGAYSIVGSSEGCVDAGFAEFFAFEHQRTDGRRCVLGCGEQVTEARVAVGGDRVVAAPHSAGKDLGESLEAGTGCCCGDACVPVGRVGLVLGLLLELDEAGYGLRDRCGAGLVPVGRVRARGVGYARRCGLGERGRKMPERV